MTTIDTTVDATLDDALGDPEEYLRRAAELDAAERFPAEACDRLDAVGFAARYVPREWGGALNDHERLLRAWRSIARRDLSVIVAHGKTYLGAAPVWLAGSPEQAATTARAVLSGIPVSWALSEPEHGADLLNNTLTARRTTDEYRLDGRKWPVNNATRSGLLTLLARTGRTGSARDHSLFLVDKSALEQGTWRPLPKVLTHGIRGIDISGIEFSGALVRSADLLGEEGSGIETVLHTLQLTRTMCPALSLGAGEHALRIVARFATERVIQRRALIERPYSRAVLARCAGLLGAVEATALVAARSVHCLTGELSVISSVVKSMAPSLVDSLVGELAEILGVRSYLTEEYAHGAFQKLARDHQIVSIFDGSTPVNRGALVQQFPRLARALAAGTVDEDGLTVSASLGAPLPSFDHAALGLFSRLGCSLVQSLPGVVETVAALNAPAHLVEQASALRAAAGRLAALMSEVSPAARPPMAAYELAAAYELCLAGAACLNVWATGHGHHRREPLWEDALWLRAALRALLTRLYRTLREPEPDGTPMDLLVDTRLAGTVAEAACTGAAITPFGTPWRSSGNGEEDS